MKKGFTPFKRIGSTRLLGSEVLSMKVSLVVMTAGKAKGQTIPVGLPQFIIGRDPQCNLRPASAVISKRHCALLIKDGQVTVRDFNSTNGTFVNDVPVSGEAPLKNDDILKLGPLEFKMLIETRPTVSKPTPLPAPAKKTADVAAGKSDDDSVAAMLLSLQEDGDKGQSENATPTGEDEIPAGSTVMDLVALKAAAAAETPSPESPKPAPAPKKPDAKNDPAHLAAKAILEKYNRRTRT